jgi:hypothetical protein
MVSWILQQTGITDMPTVAMTQVNPMVLVPQALPHQPEGSAGLKGAAAGLTAPLDQEGVTGTEIGTEETGTGQVSAEQTVLLYCHSAALLPDAAVPAKMH